MSTASPAQSFSGMATQIASPVTSSVDQLIRRVSAEVDAAAARVHALQTEAAKVFLGQESRLLHFLTVADRIEAILKPRLDAFLRVTVFHDIERNVRMERGPGGSGFHGRTTTLSVPNSDRCAAKVELSFRVGHDVSIHHAVLEYRLDILPIFIRFASLDQLLIPIGQPSEDAIAAWIDDKLVEFTRTYFEMYFTDQYQTKSFEMDPVMNVQFPRAFAAGKKEYRGRVYHFYTKESFDKFEKEPAKYIATA